LKPEDWQRWGQFTTFKSNAAELLRRELRAHHSIYCSPLVDPYQPAEAEERLMPGILDAVRDRPPRVFTLQTRGPLILRDLEMLQAIAARTTLRVSFSMPTNRDAVLKLYEPHCPSFSERIATIRALRASGIETYATLAPLLPCDPEDLAAAAVEASGRDPIGDPLHVRSVKRHGATTREAAFRIADVQGHAQWLHAEFQDEIIARIRRIAPGFETGPRGFARLAV
jgi:DNA repair photolyase